MSSCRTGVLTDCVSADLRNRYIRPGQSLEFARNHISLGFENVHQLCQLGTVRKVDAEQNHHSLDGLRDGLDGLFDIKVRILEICSSDSVPRTIKIAAGADQPVVPDLRTQSVHAAAHTILRSRKTGPTTSARLTP